MKIRKMNFADIEDTMCEEEMKCIMGGSGGGGGGMSSYNTNGSLAYGGSNPSAYSGAGGYYGNTQGWSSGFTIPSSGGSSSTSGGGGGTSSPMVLGTGWLPSNNGIKTTDPISISRFTDFMILNNGFATNSQLTTFIMNEGTIQGQQQNSIQLYGTVLNNVNVTNSYKGPSTIAPGISYNNGILDINSSAYGGGTAAGGILAGSTYVTSASSTPTYAKLTAFNSNDIHVGLNNINFSNIGKQSIIALDPITGQLDYSKTFQPTMKLNKDGAVSIANYEKLALTVYDKDSNDGQNATIGFGHKLHDGPIKVGDLQSISFDRAILFLSNDILEAERALNQKIENMGLTGRFGTSQYFALVDMMYNAGLGSEKAPSITYQVLTAMKTQGVKAANDVCIKFYTNETGGEQERKYFEAQAFINGKTLTPEQAKAELVALGLKK